MSGQQGGGLALTRIGAVVIGLEGHRVTGFFEPGEREADCDLAEILSLPAPHDSGARLLEIAHARGRFIMTVHGRVRIAASEGAVRCERPPLCAGVFRRACLRGVTRHESELVFLLDVDEVASRIAGADREEERTT
jgi:chemotaxis signal transduction protein